MFFINLSKICIRICNFVKYIFSEPCQLEFLFILGLELLLLDFYGTSITIFQKKMYNYFCSRFIVLKYVTWNINLPRKERMSHTHTFYAKHFNILKSQIVLISFLIIEES